MYACFYGSERVQELKKKKEKIALHLYLQEIVTLPLQQKLKKPIIKKKKKKNVCISCNKLAIQSQDRARHLCQIYKLRGDVM